MVDFPVSLLGCVLGVALCSKVIDGVVCSLAFFIHDKDCYGSLAPRLNQCESAAERWHC